MADNKNSPVFHMLAGPNGAGKSTIYHSRIVHKTNAPFINADHIKAKELPGTGKDGDYQAAEIAESRRRDSIANGESFVSESTFSHPSKIGLISDAKAAGFTVNLYHISLESAEKAIDRVERRTSQGGHSVPEEKIRGRYERNPALIREAALIADNAMVFDNSVDGRLPQLVLEMQRGQLIYVNKDMPAWVAGTYSPDLDKWNSLDQARNNIQDRFGKAVSLGLPTSASEGVYRGPIVDETPHHTLQITKSLKSKLGVTAHNKEDLGGVPNVGLNVVIRYKPNELARVSGVVSQRIQNNKDHER